MNEEKIKRIAEELWHLYCDLKVRDIDKLKEKIQELNRELNEGEK